MNILRPILAVLIMFIPLYPKFPMVSVKNTYVSIRLDDIVVASSLLIFFLYQLKNKFPIFKSKITKLFIVYFLAIIASTINALLVYQTDPKNILILHLLRRFEYISLFFITISTIKKTTDLFFTYVALNLTTILVCAYAYGQKYFHLPVISTMNSEFSKGQLLQMDIWTRVSGTFAGHYDLAAYLSVVLIVIFSVFLVTKNKFLKFISLATFIFAFYALTLTASRISIFAFWGGIVLTLLLLRKYLWIIPVSALVILSIFNSKDLKQRLIATIPALIKRPTPTTISVPVPTFKATPTKPKTTIPPTPTTFIIPTAVPTVVRHGPIEEVIPLDADVGVARSGEIRFNAEWPRAITAFKKNILVGTGLGSITLATDNDYLRALGESGLFGFLSFSSIFLYFILKTIKPIIHKKQTLLDQLSITLLGALTSILANAMFIDVFEASKTAYTFWIMMGVYYQILEFKKIEKS